MRGLVHQQWSRTDELRRGSRGRRVHIPRREEGGPRRRLSSSPPALLSAATVHHGISHWEEGSKPLAVELYHRAAWRRKIRKGDGASRRGRDPARAAGSSHLPVRGGARPHHTGDRRPGLLADAASPIKSADVEQPPAGGARRRLSYRAVGGYRLPPPPP